MVHDEDLTNYLPPPLNTFSDLGLRETEIVYNSQEAVISYIYFLIKTKNPWNVIPELNLSIASLELGCTVKNPGSSNNKEVLFRITGVLSIKDINLVVTTYQPELSDDENWILEAYLPSEQPIHLLDIVDKFFQNFVSIPPEIPNIPFPQLNFSVASKSKRINFSAQSNYSWDIVSLADKQRITIDYFSLDFTRNPKNLENPISGYLKGVINIAGIDLFLSASLNLDSSNGWQFKGSTGSGQEIHIGTLIDDLVNKFDEITLPSSISELIIENFGVLFNTKTKNFTFAFKSKFPSDKKQVDRKQAYITVTLNIVKQKDGSFHKYFGGRITIGDLRFSLIFDTDEKSKTFLAAYRDTNDTEISVRDLVGSISSTLDIPAGLTISLKDALFAYSKKTQTNFLLGLDIGSGINLSKLPLVGKEFPPDQTIKLAYQVLVTKADFSQTEIAHLNTLYPEGGINLPEKILTNRLDLATSMRLGNETRQLSLPIAINQNSGQLEEKSQPESTAPSSADVTSPDGTKWFQLQKSFGPAHFERIGLKYQDQKIWFLLDVALSAAGLTLSLDGLSVNSPLTELKPEFNLKGIGIDYQSGSALEIGGAFLRKQVTKDGKTVDEYDGAAVIKSETFTLSAIGSYAQYDGHPSLFIYAVLDKPIGGPSFFFVTGLAAGFGYNRALKVPTIDQVATFPLVEEAIHSNNGSSDTQDDAAKLTQELNKLQQYIPPETGQTFLAVGVKFTSFKTIDSFALLTVAFGNRFEVNLLGLSTLIAPPSTPLTGVGFLQ